MGTILSNLLGTINVPTEKDLRKVIGECEALIKKVNSKVKFGEQLSTDLNAAQSEYKNLKDTKVPMKGSDFDPDVWANKSDEEKTIAYEELQAFSDRLGNLNRIDLRRGKVWFAVVACFLVVSILSYFWLHWQGPRDASTGESAKPVPTKDVMEIQKNLAKLQILARDQSQDSTRVAMRTSFNSLKTVVVSRSNLLSSDVIELTGRLEGQIELKDLQPVLLDSIGKMLSAQVQSVNAEFFWTTDSKKWFEIMFWSIWGTLVGILFYLAGRLSGEIFDRHEIPEMVTEVIITPLVVITIFFLFDFTGITAFSPKASSIYVTLGVAFILGFAIRRTVGLLDAIKKRLLPEP